MSLTPQLPLPIRLDQHSSFNNYYEARNTELVASLKACAQGDAFKVIYVSGESGSGKSHLLFATLRHARDCYIHGSYLSLSDKSFGDLEQATALLEVVDSGQLICIDDVHCWAGELEKEKALFALFERTKHAGGQLIIASETGVEQSGFELKDLRSRLASDLVYKVKPLNDEECFSALKMRIEQKGLIVADEVIRYLLNRTNREPATLFALLENIDEAALIEKRRVTIPFLQTLL